MLENKTQRQILPFPNKGPPTSAHHPVNWDRLLYKPRYLHDICSSRLNVSAMQQIVLNKSIKHTEIWNNVRSVDKQQIIISAWIWAQISVQHCKRWNSSLDVIVTGSIIYFSNASLKSEVKMPILKREMIGCMWMGCVQNVPKANVHYNLLKHQKLAQVR